MLLVYSDGLDVALFHCEATGFIELSLSEGVRGGLRSLFDFRLGGRGFNTAGLNMFMINRWLRLLRPFLFASATAHKIFYTIIND